MPAAVELGKSNGQSSLSEALRPTTDVDEDGKCSAGGEWISACCLARLLDPSVWSLFRRFSVSSMAGRTTGLKDDR
jgi:hypothetical protein